MKFTKKQTETYVLSELKDLDPVTVYVTNYEPEKGKVVIECFDGCWSYYWGAMGAGRTLQQFFLKAGNDYLITKFLGAKSMQTDFEEINDIAHKKGFADLVVTSDVEIAWQADLMGKCFGPDWMIELPRCESSDYHWLNKIVNVIKAAFNEEVKPCQET